MNILSAVPAALGTYALSLSALASPASAQSLSFTDATSSAGIQVSIAHAADHPAAIMDGGGTIGDFNADGWPDLFIPSGGIHPDRVFLNNGNGTFTDVAASWGLTDLYRGCGSTAGDFNRDGYQDVYVTSFGDMAGAPGPGMHRLYQNTGGTGFVEVAAAAGVNTASPAVADGFGCTFGDYDRDGWLDLFVASWVTGSDGNRLFHNDGNGTFTDVTVAAGVHDTSVKGFSPRFADLNHDGWPEILLAADFGTTRIWQNLRNGTFADQTSLITPDVAYNGMGNALGDLNNDGFLDWYVTSIYHDPPQSTPNGNRLYESDKGRIFTALPASAGVNDGGFGWGTVAVDFDQDGWKDLAETGGWNVGTQWYNEQSYLWLNNGNSTFIESAVACQFNHYDMGRGMVHLDYDLDGDMDVIVFTNQTAPVLFQNDILGSACNWLQVDVDVSANPALPPDGFGTRIVATTGTTNQVSYIDGGSNYLGRSQLMGHFGFGPTTVVDELMVEWADGFCTTFTNVAVGQVLQVAAQLPFAQDPLIRGNLVDLKLSGVRDGEEAWFLSSLTGEGLGPAVFRLGGLEIDLLPPVDVLGSAFAGPSGVATLQVIVPATAPLVPVSTQAVVRRGSRGVASIKSNVITETIQP